MDNELCTENLSHSVIVDAYRAIDSLHKGDLRTAVGYLFNSDTAQMSVSRGVYYYNSPYDRDELKSGFWDGFIKFKTNTVKDLRSGEVLLLTDVIKTL